MRVLNLGAGVQSTTIFLMMLDGEIEPADVAIFADTGDEPRDVYEHVERLKTAGGPEIVTVSAGNLGDNLIDGVNSTGQRFVTIPAFLSAGDDGKNSGLGRRQCTAEYKIEPIHKEIRRRVGCVGKPIPKGIEVVQVFGLSFDEPRRVARVRAQYEGRRGWRSEFPLFDDFLTRTDCVAYLRERWPHPVPRSACVFCPYHTDDEWMRLKADPEAWARAVEIDRAIRDPSSVCTRGMTSRQYLHRSCQPLELVDLRPSPPDRQSRFAWAEMDCEGMCGN